MRRHRGHQQPLLILGLVAAILASACSDDASQVPTEPASAPPVTTDQPTPVPAEARVVVPDSAVASIAAPLDVGPEPTELGLSADSAEPLYVYAEMTMPSGEVTLSCRTSGDAGTLQVSLDSSGLLALRQDRGDGLVEVDSDTMNPRDVPAEGDPVLLGLLCGEGPDGAVTVALSVDALGVQFVTAEGQIGTDAFPFTVSGVPSTRVLAAYSLLGRDVIGAQE